MTLVANSFINLGPFAQGDLVRGPSSTAGLDAVINAQAVLYRRNTEAMIADPTPHLLTATFSIPFPNFQVRGAATGPIDGGTSVILTGQVIDTTGCSDDFTSGVIGSMWSQLTAGSGTIVAVQPDHAILVDTGVTPGSKAGLRTVGTAGNVDVEANFQSLVVSTRVGVVVAVASFALWVDALNEFRLQIEALPTGYQLRVRVVSAGTVLVDRTQFLQGPGTLGTVTMRFVRFGPRVIALMNGIKILDLGWSAAATKIEMSVLNDPTTQSRAATELTGYVRQPQVTFGTEPCIDFATKAFAAQILEVRSPAVTLPAIVDLTVTGCSTTQTVSQAFTYVLGNRLAVEETTTQALTVLGDDAIKES